MTDSIYLDFNYLLSFNALFTLCSGERGVGKTYGFKDYAITDYLKNGQKFVYVRRYDSEFDNITTFFDDIQLKQERLKDKVFKVKDNRFIMNEEEIGFYIPLSTAQQYKSMPFIQTNKLLFDEYIIDDNKHFYMKNEIHIFYNLCETIFRTRDFRAFLFGNSSNLINPYNLHFDFVNLPYNKNFSWNKELDAVFVYSQNEKYQEYKANTRFGRAVAKTSYGAFANKNKFIDVNMDMVEKKTDCYYFCTLKIKDTLLHFFMGNKYDKLYCSSKKLESEFTKTYSLYAEDSNINVYVTKNIKSNYHLKNIRFALQRGYLYYDDVKAKRLFKPYLNLFI